MRSSDWVPIIRGPKGYKTIVMALASEIEAGYLLPGDRLPTHRRLAKELDVSLGTVTRAYTEARRRGLIEGTVGRGTFVRAPQPSPTRAELDSVTDPALIDLSLNDPPSLAGTPEEAALRDRLSAVAQTLDARRTLEYQPHGGAPEHRRAGAQWVRQAGFAAKPSEVVVCAGAQHAVMCALGVLTRPGDVVLTESLTSPGIKDTAKWMGLRLHGLATDRNGIMPDALRAACEHGVGRVLYTMPTLHDPTTVTMSDSRRELIAGIVRKYNITIVENGLHALLAENGASSLVALCPNMTYYVTSLSKTIVPGLRVGFLRAPAAAIPQIEEAVRATVWMPSPLMAEMAMELIEDGTAAALLARRQAEARARQRVARDSLRGFLFAADPGGFHLWLRLGRWTPDELVEAARRRGVAITPSTVFMPGPGHPPDGVRLCLGVARDHDELKRGLDIVRELMKGEPGSPGARTPIAVGL